MKTTSKNSSKLSLPSVCIPTEKKTCFPAGNHIPVSGKGILGPLAGPISQSSPVVVDEYVARYGLAELPGVPT